MATTPNSVGRGSSTRKAPYPKRKLDPPEAALHKARTAKAFASAQAEALAGHRISLGVDDAGEVSLLGGQGQELHAEPGEGLNLRAAALLLLEAQSTYPALGQDQGRAFGIAVSGYRPCLKYSPAYQRRQSLDSRKVARKALALVERRLGAVRVDWRQPGGKVQPVAWTLTTPTLDPSIVPGVTETEEEKRLFMAWSLFRKLDLFKASVFAGFRGFEVTRKAFPDGVVYHHPHFHVLAWARYVKQADLASAWWACLRTATRKVYRFDLGDLYPTPDALARAVPACAHVQAIRKRVRRQEHPHDDLGHTGGPTSMEDAIQETLKYVSKASDLACYVPDPENPGEWILSSLPQAYLQSGVWNRSPRTFERIGAARDRWTPPDWCAVLNPDLLAAIAPEGALCSLDTSPITDGGQDAEPAQRKDTLRELMASLDLHRWLQIAARRAMSSTEHLTQALQEKGYVFPDLPPRR